MSPQDDEDANQDLYVCVSEPQEVGTGVTAYATYAVTGRSTLPGIPAEIRLRRRFADFQWLYDEVLRSSQGYLVPPLPEASVFNKLLNKFEAALLAYRTRELQRFLRRMAAHPVLRNSPQLQAFLCDDSEFEERKTKNTSTVANKAGTMFSGLFGNVKKAVVASVPSITGGPAEERDDLVKQKIQYIEALAQGLAVAAKSFHMLVESHRGLKASLAMSTEAASVLARAESFDGAAGSRQQQGWRAASNAMKDDHNALNDMVHQFQLEFEDALLDYRRYVESAQLLIKFRYGVLADLVAAEKTLDTKKNAVKQDMADIAAAEQAAATATANYERVNSCFKEEIARFEATKAREISKALSRLGRMSVTYHLKAADAYRSLIAE